MRVTTRLELSELQRRELELGYRLGEKHCFRMRCLAVLLKADGMSAAKVGERTEMEQHTVVKWFNRYKKEGIKGLETRPGMGRKGHRAGQAEREQGPGGMAAGQRQGSQRVDVQAFFISIGARYKRIRKRPRGKPSPQLYEYKAEKLQELEQKAEGGLIDLFYADESHICTEGYVPYGWQFRDEDVHIPSQKIARLNIAETLWRVLKGKWIRPQDYLSTDSLFYATDRALASVGTSLFVNHSHYAA